ncbi:nucleotide-diphospho-sugar transferase-domain-containing protein [Mycotypha africana]|uniref:nucleotide-diphospho-sugar transferase-domain-containing protein n=1 Tax=Mycotypha africana TaxID=64632 RepID=UPI0023014EDF|nr:nucleotide-diphospho-sugar transferase-domain-containing protein [Mycotypha africana]KAI8971955.1 nucleotide-diphospho-sugar transferase-domain-containing protein [Mycotypha africana]
MMCDYKLKRFLLYVVALLCSIILFLKMLNPTQNSLQPASEFVFINRGPPQNALLARQFTFDPTWQPLLYDPPPEETLMAIKRNIIVEEEIPKPGKEPQTYNILLTAVVNSGMIDYTLNWIESLRRTQQDDKFLVFAIDQGVVDALTEHGYGAQVTLIPDSWFHVPLISEFARWKSDQYRPITHAKTLVVERLLYLDVTVWFSDVDIVLLSPNIRPLMLSLMAQRPYTDMIFTQEVDHRTVNSGFYMMKPTMLTKQFLHQIVIEQDKTEKFTQQKLMNEVLKVMFPRDIVASPYRLLDLLLFPNGNFYFRMNLPQRLGIQPLMVHANYLIGDSKKNSLKEAGLWYIDSP